MYKKTRPQNSSPSDTYALVFLAGIVCFVGYLLDFMGKKLEVVYDAFYPSSLPDGTLLPALTIWALNFPFLVVGGTAAALIGWFAFSLRHRTGVQRHLVFFVSIVWCALVFVCFVAMLGFVMPMVTIFGPFQW